MIKNQRVVVEYLTNTGHDFFNKETKEKRKYGGKVDYE